LAVATWGRKEGREGGGEGWDGRGGKGRGGEGREDEVISLVTLQLAEGGVIIAKGGGWECSREGRGGQGDEEGGREGRRDRGREGKY